ncbi:MAG: 3'-5' exonuclease [Pleurocapsa sp. SU_196_0]|nr:3'-5' exonuclease [Pleurocapsa sp. SU_196_0]
MTTIWTGYRHTEFFDVRETEPAKRSTPAQIKALEKARAVKFEREEARWQAEQDKMAARLLEEEAELEAMIARDHEAMCRWAREKLEQREGFVVLDTETTGLELGCEVVQIAVLRGDGEVLLDSLVQPVRGIPDEVSLIHGITNDAVRVAPTFLEIWPRVLEAVGDRTLVIYNSSFDLRIMRESLALRGVQIELESRTRELDEFTGEAVTRFVGGGRVECAMDRYARFSGDWSRRRGAYRWWPLGGAHRAVDDCRAVLSLLEGMASSAR